MMAISRIKITLLFAFIAVGLRHYATFSVISAADASLDYFFFSFLISDYCHAMPLIRLPL